MNRHLLSFILVVTTVLAQTVEVDAMEVGSTPLLFGYVGPGAGLGAIGALVAVGAALVLGLVGLILYPIQLLRSWLTTRGTTGSKSTGLP